MPPPCCCMPSRKRLLDSFKFEDEQPAQAFSRTDFMLSGGALQKSTDINHDEVTSRLFSRICCSLENLNDKDNADQFHTGAHGFPTSRYCHSKRSEYSPTSELPNNSFPTNISENSLSEMPSLEPFCHSSYTVSPPHFSSMNLVDSMTSCSSFSCPEDALAASVVADLQCDVEETKKGGGDETTEDTDTSRPSNMPKSCLKVSTDSNIYGPRLTRRETRWTNGNSSTSSNSLPILKGR
jgi:hypothetical protein